MEQILWSNKIIWKKYGLVNMNESKSETIPSSSSSSSFMDTHNIVNVNIK